MPAKYRSVFRREFYSLSPTDSHENETHSFAWVEIIGSQKQIKVYVWILFSSLILFYVSFTPTMIQKYKNIIVFVQCV